MLCFCFNLYYNSLPLWVLSVWWNRCAACTVQYFSQCFLEREKGYFMSWWACKQSSAVCIGCYTNATIRGNYKYWFRCTPINRVTYPSFYNNCTIFLQRSNSDSITPSHVAHDPPNTPSLVSSSFHHQRHYSSISLSSKPPSIFVPDPDFRENQHMIFNKVCNLWELQ